MSVNIHRDGHG